MAKFSIHSLVENDPALSNLQRWCSGGGLAFRFREAVSEVQEKLTRENSGLSHQALADKVSQSHLTPQENDHIENVVREFNNKIQRTFQSVNEEKQRRFKLDKSNYRKAKGSPGWSKPDKNNSQYHCYSFNIQQSPFTKQNFLHLLAQSFQDLADEQQRKAFSKKQHLTADKEQLTLHNQLDKSTQALINIHQNIKHKDYELQAKEAQLRREIELLERLNRISQTYDKLAGDIKADDDLTSPAERIQELEDLLARKRKER